MLSKFSNIPVAKYKGNSPSIKGRIGISALEKWRIEISAPLEGCNLPYHVCNSIEQDRQKL